MARHSAVDISSIRDCQRLHPSRDPWSNFLSRRVSPFVSCACLRAGVHPNAITMASILSGVFTGVIMRRFGHPIADIAVIILSQLWHVLDVVDGEVARISGKTSLRGKYLDLVGHYIVDLAVAVGLLACTSSPALVEGNWLNTPSRILFVPFLWSMRITRQCGELVLGTSPSGAFRELLAGRAKTWCWLRIVALTWSGQGLMLLVGFACIADLGAHALLGGAIPFLEWIYLFYAYTLPVTVVLSGTSVWLRIARTESEHR